MEEKIFHQNEVSTNKMATAALFAFACLELLMSILGVFSVVNIGVPWECVVLMLTGAAVAVICLVVKLKKFERGWVKILIISAIILSASVTYFLFPLNTVFLIFGPILISIKYYDRKFTASVSVATWLAYCIDIVLNWVLDSKSEAIHELHVSQNALIWTQPEVIIGFRLIVRSAIFVMTGVIAVLIAGSGRKLVIKQIESMKKAAAVGAELDTAAGIQMHTMPEAHFTSPNGNIRLNAYIHPAKEVGGDFYDHFMINENLLAVMVADVSDKGLPAAMFEMQVQSAIRFALNNDTCEGDGSVTLERAMNAVNLQLSKNNRDEMFVTVWIACIDCRTGVGKFVNSGHSYPLIRHADGSIGEIINTPQPFLGIFDDIKLESGFIRLYDGDTLILYTDGVTDARNPSDEDFGKQRLIESAENCGNGSDSDILSRIVAAVDAHIGTADRFDDTTVMTVEYNGSTPVNSDIEIRAKTENITSVTDFINGLLEKTGCPDNIRRNIGVVTDEICSNICEYAYGDAANGIIHVDAEVGANYAVLTFCDFGQPFDPTELGDPEFGDEPAFGGLGVYFIRSLTDEVSYSDADGRNALTVKKVWNI